MRMPSMTRAILSIISALTLISLSSAQVPSVPPAEEAALREYAGVYQWAPNAYVYLQLWEELTGFGKPALVAFDESGSVRLLYPQEHDHFFAGSAAAVPTPVEARIEFHRDGRGAITSLTWRRETGASRTARHVDIEKHEDVQFANGQVRLAGTLITPTTVGRHPAIILVHG